MAAAAPAEKASLSFKFTKKVENKVLSCENSRTEREVNEERDYVVSVDDSVVKSSLPKAEKKELVIPLIKNNVWRVPKNEKSGTQKDAGDIHIPDEDKTELSLEQQAIKEILAEAANCGNLDSKGTTKDISIPLLMQNKVPDGFETDDKVDVSLRAEESTLEDYESVPIEEYGLAMLRGMGWNPGKPIGARCTEIAKPIEAVLRPKGLGLGADSKMAKPPPLVAKEDGDLVLRTGAYIRIEEGSHKDLYGQVEGLDDENARVIVKLALGGKTVTVSELFVSLVSKKDYQKYGKLLNKEKYDDYKKKHEAQEEVVAEKRRDEREKHTPHKRSRVEKQRESSKSAEKRERSRSPKRKEQFWLRPQIRVRFIDRKYKDGKYYNTKMTIEDVTSRTTCMCNTEDGKILEDIKASMLETVIPRKAPAHVLVLLGSYCGQVGLVLKRDKERCCATVQMLYDKAVLDFSYDSISEYTGDISHHY
ncbi:G-patch domain and KOW motifs-containing protein [Rhipicephalus microplus]|uniref:G-patch domain and KOW motifs-containing protein n=1 Tax=Rhipicephalus microplus TaxID=6941 RepID=UPI001887EB62|nr:G-patch domain and KOW motifs-containing protein-like [Rhipicephalus microplus]